MTGSVSSHVLAGGTPAGHVRSGDWVSWVRVPASPPVSDIWGPLPHTALQGRVMKKLLAFVYRTMAIAQLTHLHLSILSSGKPSGPVPPECFPVVPFSRRPLTWSDLRALVLSGGRTGDYNQARTGGHGIAQTGWYHDCTTSLRPVPHGQSLWWLGLAPASSVSVLTGSSGVYYDCPAGWYSVSGQVCLTPLYLSCSGHAVTTASIVASRVVHVGTSVPRSSRWFLVCRWHFLWSIVSRSLWW